MEDLAISVAGTLLEKLGSFAYEEICLTAAMKEDLEKLRDVTLMLQEVLQDAEKKKANNNQLQRWLLRVFKDSIDVLDEFECEVLRRQVMKEYGSAGKKVCRFFSRSNPIAFRFSLAHKVKEIRGRFDEIARDMANFQLIRAQLNVVEEPSPLSDRTTHSYLKASEVIGRDNDKARIIRMLLSQDGHDSTSDHLPVIAIVGMGGLGKTTLAKSVYNDAKLDGKFDLKLWICVSLDFDVANLLREILREIKMGEDVSSLSKDQLQISLRSHLMGRKFLLVLDDVWNEERSKWRELQQFLAVGAKGSKVIVTTRTTNVSSIMTGIPPYELRGLSDTDSLSLFNTYAFGNEIEARRHPELRDISTAIVKKCGGVPLALKTLGSLLYKKPKTEWERVEGHKIWELERDNGQILPALRLSYNAMPLCVKQCFAYCSIFPEDTLLQPMELISIWMALGILHLQNGCIENEEIGDLQIRELVARSFLQREDDETKDLGFLFSEVYKMHNLIHELACLVTNPECCIVKSDKVVVSNRVIHLWIYLNDKNLPSIWNQRKLWSLYIDPTSKYDITTSFLSKCITRFRCLRVLNMQNSSFEVVPRSIGTLKHLRYLNLSENWNVKRLPESICELQSLQTLRLDECYGLEELPRGIRKLVSLRTLTVTTKQTIFPENGIGSLKSLRFLMIIGCEKLRSLPDDMKYCTTLRTLVVINCDKFDLGCKSDDTISKLPLQSLVLLYLPRLSGCSQWLQGASKTLKYLELGYCDNLVELPNWLSEFVSLKTLCIYHCHKLEIGDCEQVNLESEPENVSPLELQVMSISWLNKVKTLPRWLKRASNTLKSLEIDCCPELKELPEWLPNLVSLETLTIRRCEKLLVLPKDMQLLTSLTSLKIEECKQLELASEPNEFVQLTLQSCFIARLPATKALPQWLRGANRTLKILHLKFCPMLDSLPEWLTEFTALEELYISGCLDLSSLPKEMSRLTSLTHLNVDFPSFAFYGRYRPEIGTNWGAISHIPNICITQPWRDEE